MWPWVWYWKRWKSHTIRLTAVWWKGGWERLLASPQGVHGTSRFHILSSGSRCLVQTVDKVDRGGILWTMSMSCSKSEAVLWKEIGKYWELKPKLIGPTSKYLGGKLRTVTLETGVKAWAFGSQSRMSGITLWVKGLRLPYKVPNPRNRRNAWVRGGWCLVLSQFDWCAT